LDQLDQSVLRVISLENPHRTDFVTAAEGRRERQQRRLTLRERDDEIAERPDIWAIEPVNQIIRFVHDIGAAILRSFGAAAIARADWPASSLKIWRSCSARSLACIFHLPAPVSAERP
jgi:hypothetical protein